MRIGIVLPIEEAPDGTTPAYPVIRAMAVAAEAGGLDSLWVYDHLLFRFDGEESGLHECWTILAGRRRRDERVELGTLVMCTSFRNPGVLAKMAATLDHISDGRLILGIGAGWHDPEYEAFGFPTDHKVSRFDEAFTIIRDLIRTGRADLDGRYVQAREPGPPAAGTRRHADPRRRQAPAHARADGPPRRRLEPRLVRAAGRTPGARPRGARGRVPAGRSGSGQPGRSRSASTSATRISDRRATTARRSRVTPRRSRRGLAAHAAAGADHVIASLDPNTPEALARFLDAVARYRGPASVGQVAIG